MRRPLHRVRRLTRHARIGVGKSLEQPLRRHRLWATLALAQRGGSPLRFRLHLLQLLAPRRQRRFCRRQHLAQTVNLDLWRFCAWIFAVAAVARIALPALRGICGLGRPLTRRLTAAARISGFLRSLGLRSCGGSFLGSFRLLFGQAPLALSLGPPLRLSPLPGVTTSHQLAGARKRVRRDLLANGRSGASSEGVKDPEFGGKKRLRPAHAAVSPFPGSYALGRMGAT